MRAAFRSCPPNILLSFLLLCVGCVRTRVAEEISDLNHSPSLGGRLAVDGTEYRLSSCYSGDRGYFLGVDLTDASERVILRVLIDPMDGPQLRLQRPPTGPAEDDFFSSLSCARLQAEVHATGWRVNRVRDFKGNLEADCTSKSGVRLEARVSFLHCH